MTSIMGTDFETKARYCDLNIQNLGTLGVVCSAYDSITHHKVAIKKISKPFKSSVLARNTFREVFLLSKLRHTNLIEMVDVFISPSEDLYIITDWIMTDLRHLIHSASNPMSGEFIQFFIYQILRALKYIHSAGVLHRDLKPSNILVNHNCDLKICDFGSARGQIDNQMTGYVTTRYYRAPEIMLNPQKYTEAVDIWSSGCIFAEMILAKPLFPGKDQVHQFTLIAEVLGKPPKQVIESITSKTTLEHIKSLPESKSRSFDTCFEQTDPQAVQLLGKLLMLNPRERITAAAALEHPYVSLYHDPEDEPVADERLDLSILETGLSSASWHKIIYDEVLNFHSSGLNMQ